MNFLVKKDYSSVAVYNLLFAILLFTFLFLSVTSSLLFLIFLIPTIALIILYNTSVCMASCKVDNEVLTFKTGFFKYVIKLEDIVEVNESTNIYPSLALSCDRIRIVVKINNKYKTYYISVLDKESLVNLLKKSIKEENLVETDKKEEKNVIAQVEEKKVEKEEPRKETTAKKSTTKKATTKKTTDKKESK